MFAIETRVEYRFTKTTCRLNRYLSDMESSDGGKKPAIQSTISFTSREYYYRSRFLVRFNNTIKGDYNATKETFRVHECTH